MMVHTRNSDGTSRDDSGFTPLQVFDEIEREANKALFCVVAAVAVASGLAWVVVQYWGA